MRPFAARSHIVKGRAYLAGRAIVTPYAAIFACFVLAVASSPWFLAGVPFAVIGSRAAQPNLNLVDGCVAYASMAVGLALLSWFKPLGLAIVAGSAGGFYLGAIEKNLRKRPLE